MCVLVCISFTSLTGQRPKSHVGITLLLLLLFYFFGVFLDEIRSLGSCPALSFACCLAIACYFFQHHLTRGSFNLQGLRTVDTWEGEGEQLLEDTQLCVLFLCFSISGNEGRAMRFRPNTRTRAATECIRKQTQPSIINVYAVSLGKQR